MLLHNNMSFVCHASENDENVIIYGKEGPLWKSYHCHIHGHTYGIRIEVALGHEKYVFMHVHFKLSCLGCLES